MFLTLGGSSPSHATKNFNKSKMSLILNSLVSYPGMRISKIGGLGTSCAPKLLSCVQFGVIIFSLFDLLVAFRRIPQLNVWIYGERAQPCRHFFHMHTSG